MRLFKHTDSHWRARMGAGVLAVALVAGVTACDSLLEVSNPNNISGDDTETAQAAPGLVNGAEALVTDAFGEWMASIAT